MSAIIKTGPNSGKLKERCFGGFVCLAGVVYCAWSAGLVIDAHAPLMGCEGSCMTSFLAPLFSRGQALRTGAALGLLAGCVLAWVLGCPRRQQNASAAVATAFAEGRGGHWQRHPALAG